MLRRAGLLEDRVADPRQTAVVGGILTVNLIENDRDRSGRLGKLQKVDTVGTGLELGDLDVGLNDEEVILGQFVVTDAASIPPR